MDELEYDRRAALANAAADIAHARTRVRRAAAAEWRSIWGERFRAELDEAARALDVLLARIDAA